MPQEIPTLAELTAAQAKLDAYNAASGSNLKMEQPSRDLLDLDACRANVDSYAAAGDARSCRDIAIAVMRENHDLRAALAVQVEETQQIAAELAQERIHLNEAADTLIGSVENGPWVLITDPTLRQIVGEYIADACHSIAAAAGLDEAMERAHDAMPQRLARSLPTANVGKPS